MHSSCEEPPAAIIRSIKRFILICRSAGGRKGCHPSRLSRPKALETEILPPWKWCLVAGFFLLANPFQCWFVTGKLREGAVGKPCGFTDANNAKTQTFSVLKVWRKGRESVGGWREGWQDMQQGRFWVTPKILLLFLVAECMSVGSKCACIETSILLSSVTFQSLIALLSNIIEPNISPFFFFYQLIFSWGWHSKFSCKMHFKSKHVLLPPWLNKGCNHDRQLTLAEKCWLQAHLFVLTPLIFDPLCR